MLSNNIILQNIDNIEEYYVPNYTNTNNNNIIHINSGIFMYGQFTDDKKDDVKKDDVKKDDKKDDKLDKLNKYLKNYKYINTNDILYTFYDIYNDNIIKCIIAKYKKKDGNYIYIIQIKDDFFNNNKKLFNKKKRLMLLGELQNTYNNTILTKLLE